MGKSLIISKAEPFINHPSVSHLYIFSEKEAHPIPKTSYITLPGWITGFKPAFIARFIRRFAEPVQLVHYARKIKPDIINGYHLIPKGINSLLAARLSGSKSILSVIGGIPEIETYGLLRYLFKQLNLLALKKTDLITTKGSIVNSYLDRYAIPSSKIMVYNGSIDFKKFSFNPLTSKDIDILFVGTFRNLKGPDRVLHIISALKKDFSELKAYLVGQGYLFDECKRLSSVLGISENIVFTGHTDNPSGYFQKSKIFVLPSRSEGLPTSMLEAMACGCVPVVSNVGNIRDAARHKVNAFLVDDFSDINSFVQYIKILLSDEPLRKLMAEQGIQTVKDNYSIARQAKIVDQMIIKLFPDHVSDKLD